VQKQICQAAAGLVVVVGLGAFAGAGHDRGTVDGRSHPQPPMGADGGSVAEQAALGQRSRARAAARPAAGTARHVIALSSIS